MTSLDFNISLKHSFIVMHVAMMVASATYMSLGKMQETIIFLTSSVIALTYYLLFTQMNIQRRIQAHLNLIEEAVENSEEFKDKVSKSTQNEQKEEGEEN